MREFVSTPARSIDFGEQSIDEMIAVEREQLHLQQSKPSIYSSVVSKHARDKWQEYQWMNRERVRHFQVRDQGLVTIDRPGRAIHVQSIVKKLNTLPGRRFRLNDFSLMSYRGVAVSRGGAPLQYLCAFQDGVCPEWDKISLDDHGLPKRVTQRGWRTTLMMIHDMGFLTEKELYSLFGHPWGEGGSAWRRAMWEFRNHRLWDGQENQEYWRMKVRENF